jgi:1-deoxy-D-xylulose-5-phosphate synthase
MLDSIKKPQDIKKLRIDQLIALARDVRKRIIDVTAKNGGHVAPSLGTTDLTVALLKVFNPKTDRIVWDVGHQSYAFKILTERNDRFDTLRQFNGISGFNNIFESEYDAFGVGHASTSISAALGIKVARDIQNTNGRVVAIIGDGALTGGLAFEGLNHTGHLQKNMIVILNDNNMSISRNVGALQKYLTDILVSRSYNALKEKIWDIVHHFPSRYRRRLIALAQKFEENLINSFVPNVIFEDLGFKYVGPVDGHDINRLVSVLSKVKRNMVGPVLIHVVSIKGKGYDFAEDDASKFHGLGPYEIKTGKCVKKSGVSYSNVFGDTLTEIADTDENVVTITAAMTAGTGLEGYAKAHPKRFFDVGIAEEHAVTFAAGMATQGIKPFVAIYSTFLQRALDQVIHDVALQKLPVVFCLDRAGLVGEDGATHHGAFDLSYLNLVPGITIAAPSDANELQSMLRFAASWQQGPIAIRYPRGSARFCDSQRPAIEPGKGVVTQPDGDIVFLGLGNGYNIAVETAGILHKRHPQRKIMLVDMRFAKPLDTQLLDSLRGSATHIVTFEENSVVGGFGSTVAHYFAQDAIPVTTCGIPDEFVPHGSMSELYQAIGFTPETIADKLDGIL